MLSPKTVKFCATGGFRTSTCKIGGKNVTGRKTRGLQMEGVGCKCQTFFISLLSCRRKQTTSDIFFPLLYTNLYLQKKKCKKVKWLSEEALQIAEERRVAKGKGKKERYTHLNPEFQRIARRDKKAFLSDQHKEIEENNRMGKTRDLFKKITDTKGIFHAKMGSIKDRNGMDLTEAEILRRGGKNTQKNYTKKIFNTKIITMV